MARREGKKAQATIAIKWVRSGIGFPYRMKTMVRSLGLQRLNQVVERPDTPQIRGLVSRIPHLVEIVDAPAKAEPWASVPEYTIHAPEAAPEKPRRKKAAAVAPGEAKEEAREMKRAREAEKAKEEKAAEPAKAAKGHKPAKAVAASKGKAAEAKKGKAAAKGAKPAKKGKK